MNSKQCVIYKIVVILIEKNFGSEVSLVLNEKKTLSDGNTLCLGKEGVEWILKYGARKVISVIELKSILNNFNVESKTLCKSI